MGSRSRFRISPPPGSGSMVASGANGFASVLWDPNGTNCDRPTHELKHDFHPAYATSSEHTRVPGAAIRTTSPFRTRSGTSSIAARLLWSSVRARPSPGGIRSRDSMTSACLDAGFLAAFGLLHIGGCIDGDADFEGVPYRKNTWPGSFKGPRTGCALPCGAGDLLQSVAHPTARVKRRISAALLSKSDMPRIEFGTNPAVPATPVEPCG